MQRKLRRNRKSILRPAVKGVLVALPLGGAGLLTAYLLSEQRHVAVAVLVVAAVLIGLAAGALRLQGDDGRIVK